jgi:TRAP-type mannitol/chloroaromatic compound transport system permease large subunit
MDAFVLLGSFVVLMLIGLPVAYCLGLAALIGALWIDLPLDAVMIQIGAGVNKFSLLAIPFFVLAGAIMAEGGMARRLHLLRCDIRIIGGRHGLHRIGAYS